MNPLPLSVLYYGKEQALPETRELRAGPLSAALEEGDLLSIRWGGFELLRRIYVAVRDRNWGTVPRHLRNLKVHSDPGSFRISYQAEHRQGEINFVWDADIHATAQGTLTFSMQGEARSTFLRNRIGFCLLHPAAEFAGCRFTAQRDDGSKVEGSFPTAIALEQPIVGTECMQALAFEAEPSGLRAEIEFSGDLFEMEDQRNWTDATYKTFSTPLSLACPVEVRKGDRVSQAIRLKITDLQAARPVLVEEGRIKLVVGEAVGMKLPRIGLGLATEGRTLTETEITRLRALRLSHLRVDLRLSEVGYSDILAMGANQAKRLEVSLEAALFLSDPAEGGLRSLIEMLQRLQPPISRWLLFDATGNAASETCVKQARQLLGFWNSQTQFASGTDANFYQLGQARPPVQWLDLLCYSIHPQEHAFDNRSLVETLEIQGETVRNAREFAGNLPIVISPVTLKPRFNPDATAALPSPQAGELPPEVDLRQMSLFGAAWTLGSLKSLTESGVISTTYYETTGWRGVMERAGGSPLPELFRSLPGSVFPLYHIMADVGEFRDGEIVAVESNAPLKATGLAFFGDDIKRLLMANLTSDPQRVVVEGLADRVRLWQLNEDSVMQAMTSPEEFRSRPGDPLQTSAGTLELTLSPYAVARIDEDPG